MIKRYDPNDNGPMRQFVGMDEHEFGDWVKFDDVEESLNSVQQLKAEILPLVERGIVATDAKCGTANYLFREIHAKLSAV